MQVEKKIKNSSSKTLTEIQTAPPSSTSKKRLVLFDFDGTITTKDTLIEFLTFYKGKVRLLAGLVILSPMLALYALRLIPNWKAKQHLLKYFIGGAKLD